MDTERKNAVAVPAFRADPRYEIERFKIAFHQESRAREIYLAQHVNSEPKRYVRFIGMTCGNFRINGGQGRVEQNHIVRCARRRVVPVEVEFLDDTDFGFIAGANGSYGDISRCVLLEGGLIFRHGIGIPDGVVRRA